MFPQVHAMITEEYDDRLLVEAQSINGVQNFADLRIDERGASVVTAD